VASARGRSIDEVAGDYPVAAASSRAGTPASIVSGTHAGGSST
jgi:hypothetical protein